MNFLKRDGLFLLLVSFIYGGFQFLIPYLSSDELVRKALYVNQILVYIPAVVFLVSLVYGVLYGFKIRYPLYVFLLFPLTLIALGEWIFLYQIMYSLFSLLGVGVGHLIYRLRKRH
ncbi:hypothetical protein AB1I63_05385 [Streptococcus pneumoniae]